MSSSIDPQAPSAQHELAAIMFSDIASYTAIMGRDEESAMRALDAHRLTLRTLLPKFNGRLIGEVGDGTLSSFHSAIDAVNCARHIQVLAAGSPDLQLRIGIHLGDVVFTNNTVIGDGVNVASRIHALAMPGAICVSGAVYDEIRNKPGIIARALGEKKLKNVSRPVKVYELGLEVSTGHTAWIRRHRYFVALRVGAGALAILALVYFVVRKSATPHRNVELAAPSHPLRSIAVLPLDNYSGDPNQEYFADGMTDELTTDLATISQLRVISRGSVMRFKGEHRPPTPEIAKLLNVDAVIEGSVLRVGHRVRITAQLIDAPADQHLWAKSFERDSRDVLTLQDELASAIAKEIEVRLTPGEQQRLTHATTVNPAAHDAYLKGRYFVDRPNDENITKAIAQFQEAIRLEPNLALAYSGLADAFNWAGTSEGVLTAAEGMAKSKAAAETAVRLDQNSAEAHTSLGLYLYSYEFDWIGAEREFRRAIELNPSYASAHDFFSFALAQQGRLVEASAENVLAVQLDPLSPEILAMSAWALAWQEKYDAAKQMTRKALDLDPSNVFAQFMMGWTDVQAGNISDAIPELQRALAMKGPPYAASYLGYVYAASGDRTHAIAEIEELKKRAVHGYVDPYHLAIIHLGLGDRERALTGLEEAYRAHSQFCGLLKMDRAFAPLRSEPRFIALLKKMHFQS